MGPLNHGTPKLTRSTAISRLDENRSWIHPHVHWHFQMGHEAAHRWNTAPLIFDRHQAAQMAKIFRLKERTLNLTRKIVIAAVTHDTRGQRVLDVPK